MNFVSYQCSRAFLSLASRFPSDAYRQGLVTLSGSPRQPGEAGSALLDEGNICPAIIDLTEDAVGLGPKGETVRGGDL